MENQGQLTTRIAEILPSLSGALERAAAFYLSYDPSAAAKLTIREAALQSGISESSITRFARKLGFSGYHAFQQELAQSTQTLESLFPVYENIHRGDNATHICNCVCTQTAAALEDTYALLHIQTLEMLADAVIHAKRIFLYTNGRSTLAAESLRFRLSRLGIHAQLLTDPGEQLWCANYAQPDDLFITFSIWGKYKNVASCFRRAQTAGAKTAAFTAALQSPLAQYCTLVIQLAPEPRVFNGHTFSSIVELTMSDCLYILVGRRLGSSVNIILERTAKSLNLERTDFYDLLPTEYDPISGILDLDNTQSHR